jgi:RHS repeat-associated protein
MNMHRRITLGASLAIVLVLGPATSQARWLNPRTGRFHTMDSYAGDPQQPLSLHKYLYATDNPVNLVDATGNFSEAEVMVASTISVGLSIWATATIVKTGVAIKQGADVQGLAQRLGVRVKEMEEDPLYYYFLHGTSLRTWGPSLKIDAEGGTGKDFGRGFYTFADDEDGRYWAGHRARQSTHGILDVPIVIGVKIRKDEFATMSKKDFREPSLAPAWQPFVKACRSGQRNYGGAGVIIGPVSNGNNYYPEVHPQIKIPQYKFESGATRLSFAYIYPAWGVLEAGL